MEPGPVTAAEEGMTPQRPESVRANTQAVFVSVDVKAERPQIDCIPEALLI